MKYKNSIRIILVLVACLSIPLWGKGQQKWQIQAVAIPTRWAKMVNPTNVLPEYPRPQMVRKNWQNLNGLWDFGITKKDATKPIKYGGKLLVPYPIESALSGVKKALQPDENLWYKRIIAKPLFKPGERVLLHFGAVDFEATVYVNGKAVGKHTGGYQNFSFDITDKLIQGKNELTVKVWDPTDKGPNPHGKQTLKPSGIMYTSSSGIWQTVWMEVVPQVSIVSLKMTPDVDGGKLDLKVSLKGDAKGYEVEAVAYNAGKTISTLSVIPEGERSSMVLKIPNGRLWSPDDPFLYDLVIRLKKDGKVVDEVKSYFGMRKIEVKKDDKGIERIFLNNKYTYNLGTLDQGFWPDGLYTAPTDAALKFDVQAAKAMGFNTIRKHIKIEPARWYYHCDKLGMLVWQDMVNAANHSKEAQEQFEKENLENLAQLYNYPSITTWVLFNEGWGAYDQPRLTKWMKDTDPSRLVNGHSGENLFADSPKDLTQKWANSDMTDIHAYPPPAIPDRLPGKARVVGEFGGIGVFTEGHLWNDLIAAGWGYVKVTPGQLVQSYSKMVESLKVLETKGLSGSIYTQPFDVEEEQNGLMTYDREVIKMPLTDLRAFHSKIIPTTANYAEVTRDFTARAADTANTDNQYLSRLQEYKNGRKDEVFLRRLVLMASRLKKDSIAAVISSDYVDQIKNPFTEFNLKFIYQFTRSTRHSGFQLMRTNPSKVNAILGKDQAEAMLTFLIENEEISPKTKKGLTPDWKEIENKVVSKYGTLGEEIIWQSKAFYYLNHKDYKNFVLVAVPWYNKYGQKRAWVGAEMLNSIAWRVFENSSDTAALQLALSMSKRSVELDDKDVHLMDTYANLLYKLGKKEEAITWQKKAVSTDPDHALIQDFKDTLEKMENGVKTWKNN